MLPFYISLFTTARSASIIRVLRLARVLRVLKLTKNNPAVLMLYQTLLQSEKVLSLLFFFVVLGVVVFGSLAYFFEQGQFMVMDDQYPEGAYYRLNQFGTNYEVTQFRRYISKVKYA